MHVKTMGIILLYYKYVDIEDPEYVACWQRALATPLDLRGRIIVAKEGINGTVGGSIAAIEAYKKAMKAHPLFSTIDFKESSGEAEHFPRLRILVKKEIVSLGISPQEVSAHAAAPLLTPAEVHAKMVTPSSDLLVFDIRNNYETRIGTFDNALTAEISTFRQLPSFIDNNVALFQNKEIVMACTGGVRCERASAYLASKGTAKQVYQLAGGIHRYLEQYPSGFFRGKNFVFDGRVALGTSDEIIANCLTCKCPCDTYSRCVNMCCNQLLIMCDACKKTALVTCSVQCSEYLAQERGALRTSSFTYFPRTEDVCQVNE